MSVKNQESEENTRRKRVDPRLESHAWTIIPFEAEKPLSHYKAHALTEYPTANGPAAYAIVVRGQILGIVEAKKVTLGPQGVLTQAERYSKGVTDSPFNFSGRRVPFLYSTNGEVIWFQDVRHELNTAREIKGFHEITLDLGNKEPGIIAVSGFTTRDGKTSALIALLDEMAVVAIGKVERMKLTERKRLDVILQEQELALSDLMDTSKALRVGQFLAADYLLTGSVIEMDRTVIIFGRLINVETAEIESVAQVVVPKTADVKNLF